MLKSNDIKLAEGDIVMNNSFTSLQIISDWFRFEIWLVLFRLMLQE